MSFGTVFATLIVVIALFVVAWFVIKDNVDARKYLARQLNITESDSESGSGLVNVWGGSGAPTPKKLLTLPSGNFTGIISLKPDKNTPPGLAGLAYVGYILARQGTPTEIRPIYEREVTLDTRKEKMIVTANNLDIFVKSAITGPYAVDWTLQPLKQIE